MSSQLVGLIAAVAQDSNASASQLETAAWAAKNSTQYNFLAHQDLDGFEAEARECKALGTCDKVQQKYRDLSLVNQDAVFDSCVQAPSTCIQLFGQLINDQKSLQERIAHLQLDSSIPFELKVDLARYQLQNTSAISELIATESKLANIENGASVSKADRDSLILSAVSGGLFGKAGANTKGTKPLGLGSTGRSTPANLNEKLAMEQAMSNPTAGRPLPVPMTDPRWPAADGWVKSAQNINGIEIHYVRNSKTGAIDDFKLK
ncbi:hypothetical protein ACVI9W_004941 [Pseudomonas sp. 210_17 TE3656]